MSEVVLTGLDGMNPLGFLAALGVLNVLSDELGDDACRMSWRELDAWRPVVQCSEVDAIDAVVDAVMRDRDSMYDEKALALKYEKGKGKQAWDLKPPPERFRRYLLDLVNDAPRGKLASMRQRRSLDYAAAFATEIATDNSGNTKPTALHFTAGQQEFLSSVDEILRGVTPEDVENALLGPWTYVGKLKQLNWDATVARDYALRASDPSKEQRASVPGADWLAFRGLTFLRVAAVRDRIETTGCSGGWKSGRFCWPLWTARLTRPVVQTLMQYPDLARLDEGDRVALGVGVVLESSIRRSDQGGYGSFAPATLL